MTISDLPAVNASLNGCSLVLLSLGFWFIKQKRVGAHRACMVGACVVSTIFLASYLTYHFSVTAITKFSGTGWVRYLYFVILVSHIILAIAIVPMVLMTLWRAIKGQFDRHRALARWTWPIWMYVSVTGVIVYVMLYHLYAPGK